MDIAVAVYLSGSGLYAGFQLTVRGVVYPQMAQVPAAAWVVYELAHQRRISRVVGPLFALLAAGAVWLLADGRAGAGVAALALFGGLLAVTAFGAVPLHRMLSERFDAAAHRRLLRWDTVRTLLAVGQLAVALALVRW